MRFLDQHLKDRLIKDEVEKRDLSDIREIELDVIFCVFQSYGSMFTF